MKSKKLFYGKQLSNIKLSFLFTIVILFITMLIIAPVIFAKEYKPAVSYDIVRTAEITKVSYYLNELHGKNYIFFEIEIKNISEIPKRYKLKVSIHNGPSAVYYYPRTGKPPVIKPNEAYVKPFPIVPFNKLPQGFTIKVEEM